MNIKGNAILHNRFDIIVSNIKTGEIVQRGQAENIVLDRMYTRLCNFQTYFTYIVFGTGTGTPTASRTTLFSKLGYKTAVDEEIVRSYPTSKWVKKIRLESSEYNGNTITEVGISEDITSVNTHALITDSEGNPLSIVKNDLTVIDIYATVFIEIPNVDSGLFYISNGWRDYLAGGGTAPSNVIAVSTTQSDETDTSSKYTQTGTRTVDTTNKRVKVATRLEAATYNRDIQLVSWLGTGLTVKLPRIGIFEGKQRNNIQIGVGDGVKTKFSIPNILFENLSMTVDNVIVSNWTLDSLNNVVFDTPITANSIVKASYKSLLIPKDSTNVLDIEMTIQYDNLGSLPTPIYTPSFSLVPGNKTVIAGTSDYGFFGEVTATELFSGDELATLLGLTAGISQNSDAGWLKVIDGSKMLLIAKKTLRSSTLWNNINDVGAVWGKKISKDGVNYIIRLLSSIEWDRFMYPLHVDHPSSSAIWSNYSNEDLNVGVGDGRATWTSTPSSYRVTRGNNGVSDLSNGTSSGAGSLGGWRPVLEVLV